MHIAVISDIHSNLEALHAVLEDLKDRNIQKIFCLGDLVGYGASPNECIQLVLENKMDCLAGNHDRAAVSLKKIEFFNSYAKDAALWTNSTLTEENKEILKNLPTSIIGEQAVFVHGAISGKDDYILNTANGIENIKLLKQQYPEHNICFFGHTHIKNIFFEDEGFLPVSYTTPVTLKPDYCYLINPGSVGQPRDGNPDASYLIFDEENTTVQHVVVPYDIKLAQKKIIDAGLPPFLASRLEMGK